MGYTPDLIEADKVMPLLRRMQRARRSALFQPRQPRSLLRVGGGGGCVLDRLVERQDPRGGVLSARSRRGRGRRRGGWLRRHRRACVGGADKDIWEGDERAPRRQPTPRNC